MPKVNNFVNTPITWLIMPSPMLLSVSAQAYVTRRRRHPTSASIAMSRKKTGVASTMTWASCMQRMLGGFAARACPRMP